MRLKEAIDRPESRERLYEWQRLQRVANGKVGHYDRDLYENKLASSLKGEIFGDPNTKVMDIYLRDGITSDVKNYWDRMYEWMNLDLKTRNYITSEDAKRRIEDIVNNPQQEQLVIANSPSVVQRLRSVSNRFRGANRSAK